jgi:hypothetical protein
MTAKAVRAAMRRTVCELGFFGNLRLLRVPGVRSLHPQDTAVIEQASLMHRNRLLMLNVVLEKYPKSAAPAKGRAIQCRRMQERNQTSGYAA